MGENIKFSSKSIIIILLLTGSSLYLYRNLQLITAVLFCASLCLCLAVFSHRCMLNKRLSVSSMAIMGYTVLYAASCLFGPYGSMSLANASSLLIGTAGYILLLAFCGDKTAFELPMILCTGSGVVALLSLDASSAQILTPRILMPVLSRVGGPSLSEIQYEEGKRIIGVVGGANVLAGLLGIGIILGIYVFLNTQGKQRIISAISLVLNASVFFLAFSIGAFCAFTMAVLVYLKCTPSEKRNSVFLCMVMTAVLSLLCVALMTSGLGRYQSVASYFTLLCPFVFGLGLYFVFPAASAALKLIMIKESRKKQIILGAVVALLIILYVVLAITISTPITLTPWGAERNAYMAPGDYTISLTAESPVKVLIASQSRDELLDGYYNYLYEGNTLKASFTVPQDAGIVRFSFIGSGKLYRAAFDGVQSGELRMNSPLMPEFVTNRMRGLFFSKNVFERLEMFRDGLKLFASSPVLGCGAGAFEAKAYSVQRHYYETKYVHNQYIQCLVDTGLIGLVLFLTILAATFLKIFRRSSENPALATVLTACLVMAAIHGLSEVVWSMHAYLMFLLAMLALCELAYPAPIKGKRLKVCAKWVYTALALAFSIAIVIHLFVQKEYRSTPENAFTPEQVASLCKKEPFSKEVYQLDYVCNYGADAAKSGGYLAELRSRKSYDINMLLLKYVYLPVWDRENILTAVNEAYQDRRCDKKALDGLYSLLEANDAEELIWEDKN